MKRILLDAYTDKEIKEMIDRNEIDLKEIDSDKLSDLMNNEIDMICFSEGDTDFISRCAMILEEREGKEASKNDVMDIILRTENERVIITDKKPILKRRIRVIFKRASLIAVVISIMLCCSACMAVMFGFDIFSCVSKIARQPAGSIIHMNEYTFVNNGDIIKYNSLDEIMETQNLNIVYPTKFPEGIKTSVVFIEPELNCLMISTNEHDVNFSVYFNSEQHSYSHDEILKLNGMEFFLQYKNPCIAIFHYDNNEYIVAARSREELIIILQNLKFPS